MASLPLTPAELAAWIDHTLLAPDATAGDVEKLCAEARQFRFHGVCVNGSRVELAHHLLEDTLIQVVATVAYPFGAMAQDAKRFETEAAIDDGAQEIDVVMNIGLLKDRADQAVLRELRDVVEAADDRPVKVILQSSLLTAEEKLRACALAIESGAKFLNMSAGWNGPGATAEDVKLLRQAAGQDLGIAASGGMCDFKTAIQLLQAGATRLGVSASVAIVQQ
ncbi:MAG TPA: deoxyribose-phosphate aldolase [Verrucomicrobiae bacterium]|nr:deoxyribose-phosphate aldolase [Verrucomicrobiae bacterium]